MRLDGVLKNSLIFRCSEREVYLKSLSYHFVSLKIKPTVIIDFPENKALIEKYFNAPIFISWWDSVRSKRSNTFNAGYKRLEHNAYIFSKLFLDRAADVINRTNLHQQFSKNELNAIYFSSIDDALDLLITNKIDVVYFHDIPHHIDAFALYVSAKYLGITTIIFSIIFFGQTRVCIDTTIDNRGESIKKGLKVNHGLDDRDQIIRKNMESRDNYISPPYMSFNISRKNFFLLFANRIFGKNSIFFYMILDFYRYTSWGLFKYRPYSMSWNNVPFHLQKSPLNLKMLWIALNVKLRIKKITRIYSEISSNKLPEQYVLFAPNYQPEATTQPSAGHYSSVITCLRLLRGRLPKNVSIVYKEHNSIFDLRNEAYAERDKYFYNSILEVDNLTIAPMNSSTLDLIEKSLFVVTLTSTIALEAITKKKVAVLFGSAWFDRMMNIVRWVDLDSSEDLMEAIRFQQTDSNNELFDNLSSYCFRVDDENLENNSKHAAAFLNLAYQNQEDLIYPSTSP